MTDRILILDFGSQVTQLIARRVRENGVYCEIHPFTMSADAHPRLRARAAIILSGGPASVTQTTTPRAPEIVFQLGVPVLAICYGMQTMCAQLGGRVTPQRPPGIRPRLRSTSSPTAALFDGLWPKGAREQVWMSHGDKVDALPAGFRVVAATDSAPYAAIADDARRFYGVPVPPRGRAHAAGRAAAAELHPPRLRLRRRLDDGGVPRPGDRSASATRSAGGTGRLRPLRRRRFRGRRGAASTRRSATSSPASLSTPACCAWARPRRSCGLFRGHHNIPLIHRDAGDLFLGKLAGITDPEHKRKIIGATFIDVFDEEAQQDRRRRLPRARHALPRRHRVGERHRRPLASPSSRTTMSAACRRG